jgi:hypothetical protein
LRIDRVKSAEGQYAMYFHCQTTLVDTFKEIFRGRFVFEGNRALLFDETDAVPVKELRHCIALALTYNLDKKNKRPARRSARRPRSK